MLKPSCHRTRHHLPHRIDVQADPNDKSMLIFLTHNMVELDQMPYGIGFAVYEAIMQFQDLASASLR